MAASSDPRRGRVLRRMTGPGAAARDATAGRGAAVAWPVVVSGQSWRVASGWSGDQVDPALRNEPYRRRLCNVPYRRRLFPWLTVNGGAVWGFPRLRGVGWG
jgi:hypothetical protein